jgi:hypothetical protein
VINVLGNEYNEKKIKLIRINNFITINKKNEVNKSEFLTQIRKLSYDLRNIFNYH